MNKKIVIIGAGPTGLGAAYRLNELGYGNWEVYEKNSFPGGLSASFKDESGFYWDAGGHVMFSHYPYYDSVVSKVLGKDYLSHIRESWIWIMNCFVPYPFQNNIRHLPKKQMEECLTGLEKSSQLKQKSENFKDWIYATFGEGIAKYFMIPYNEEVWAFPLNKMAKEWISERVSVVGINQIRKNISEKKDDVSWGPNNKFIFPKQGATGEVFRRIAELFGNKIKYNKELESVDVKNKAVFFSDGTKAEYDYLISSIPLSQLVKKSKLKDFYADAKKLSYSSSYIIGIGVEGKCPSNKNWVYYPEHDTPFYRLTYLSNYSPFNAPINCFSLLTEVSYSKYKKERKDKIIEETINGMISSKIIQKSDIDKIKSKFLIDLAYAYPIPTLERDSALKKIQPFLMSNDIFSRGRFGAWRYETGNMDHSFMQGVEVVDRIVNNKPESIWRR